MKVRDVFLREHSTISTCEHEWVDCVWEKRGRGGGYVSVRLCIKCMRTMEWIDLEKVFYAESMARRKAESECKRLRVCGNCRHYSQGYTVDCCVKYLGHGEKETRRSNTCNDWEMV